MGCKRVALGIIQIFLMTACLTVFAPLSTTFAADDLPTLDTSCTADADCAVKELRNCCGLYPACVNVKAEIDTELDPEGCADTASVCGYETILACHCENNQCQRIDTRPPAAP